MKFHPDIQVFGDVKFRGDCPSETLEAITFFAKIRKEYPETFGKIATHIRNEGKRSHQQTSMQKAEGMTTGASDILIPGSPSFCCELKRQDHTKSKWQDGQQKHLLEAQKQGSFVCVALGYKAAYDAFIYWNEKYLLQNRK